MPLLRRLACKCQPRSWKFGLWWSRVNLIGCSKVAQKNQPATNTCSSYQQMHRLRPFLILVKSNCMALNLNMSAVCQLNQTAIRPRITQKHESLGREHIVDPTSCTASSPDGSLRKVMVFLKKCWTGAGLELLFWEVYCQLFPSHDYEESKEQKSPGDMKPHTTVDLWWIATSVW